VVVERGSVAASIHVYGNLFYPDLGDYSDGMMVGDEETPSRGIIIAHRQPHNGIPPLDIGICLVGDAVQVITCTNSGSPGSSILSEEYSHDISQDIDRTWVGWRVQIPHLQSIRQIHLANNRSIK
jgi:hypothetical protein